MNKREPLADTPYFEYAISYCREDIATLKGYIERQDSEIPNWSRIHSRLYTSQLSMVLYLYSAGYPVAECKEYVVEAIENFILAETLDDAEPENYTIYNGIYDEVIKLASLGLLFNTEKTLLGIFREVCDKTKGSDLLINALLSKIPGTRQDGKLFYPKIFRDIYSIFECNPDQQNAMMAKYLKNWFTFMKRFDWHNSHKVAKVNGSTVFEGYWSVEAAAACFVLQLDFSNFKDLSYFPVDMLKFASGGDV